MARSKVKSRSHHDVAHLHPLTNVPTKYQLPTPQGFCDIARTRFYRSRSLQQGQIKVKLWCCTNTPPNQCHYHVSTSYTVQFPRYSQTRFYRSRSLRQGQIKVTPWRCTPTPPYHVWTSYTLQFPRYRPDKLLPGQYGWKQYPDSP